MLFPAKMQCFQNIVPTELVNFFLFYIKVYVLLRKTVLAQVFTLKGIDFDRMHVCISNGELSGLKQVQEAMTSSLDTPWSQDGALVCLLKCEDGVTAGFDCGHLVSPTCGPAPCARDVTKLTRAVTSCTDVIFCLEEDTGAISTFCPYTMLQIDRWQDEAKVRQLTLIEDEGDSALKLMLVTDEADGTYFQIRAYPTYQVLYKLKVTQYCVILDTCLNQENPMIIEGSTDEDGKVTSLRLRSICEGSPKSRLEVSCQSKAIPKRKYKLDVWLLIGCSIPKNCEARDQSWLNETFYLQCSAFVLTAT